MENVKRCYSPLFLITFTIYPYNLRKRKRREEKKKGGRENKGRGETKAVSNPLSYLPYTSSKKKRKRSKRRKGRKEKGRNPPVYYSL